MANTYFFTGFPGFIATELIKQLFQDQLTVEHIYLLVLPSEIEKAESQINQIIENEKLDRSQLSIIKGDITKEKLGISLEVELESKVTHVFHLAAIYDLAVPIDIAYNVNVKGTHHVNQWIKTLPNLKRYIYFSTAYVSGTREGNILETELDVNQSFKNHYELTKFEAEKLIKEIVNDVPTTIIRPGIVKGHSETGETIKFDGAYFILNFLNKLRFFPFIPQLGDGPAEGNFVPVDYIFKATLYLGHADVGIGKTYHLTDPKPYKMTEVYRFLMEKYLGRKPVGVIPLSVGKFSLSIRAIRKWIRVEKEALDYFTFMSHYDCTLAQKDLEGSGIACPDFKDTLDSMVEFYKNHKNDRGRHVTIL